MRWCSALAVFQVLVIFVLATNSYENDDITLEPDPAACEDCEAVQNKDDGLYYMLAQISIKKYMDDRGLDQFQEVQDVTGVCKQNMAKLIRINFDAVPTNCTLDNIQTVNGSVCIILDTPHYLSCILIADVHWWLDNPEMEISCKNQSRTGNILGGQSVQNASSPRYRIMAEESLMKYMTDNGLNQHYEILQVKNVTTQVVPEKITRIDFDVKLNFSNVISCHSETLFRPWLYDEEINVTCLEQNSRLKRQIPGGLAEQNANDPIYREMAEDSLMKYMKDNGLNQQHEILHVKKVTTQVVAGIITRIDFNAKLDNSNIISCHSEIWDRPWLNEKEINITCIEQNNRQKRQIPGGLAEQNANDPIYREMAEDSLIKYMKDNGLNQQHEILHVKKVTTQVVAGIITRIDFNAKLDYSNVISCHSEIWDRPWLNEKEINITCVEQNNRRKD